MKKILIVDDEEDILVVLKSYLTRLGYEVETNTTCEKGIEKFYLFKPDLVLLDVNIGDGVGRIMCKTIKAQAAYKNIPVILFSANPLMLLNFGDYGATYVLDKPFDLPNLLKVVQSHLNKLQRITINSIKIVTAHFKNLILENDGSHIITSLQFNIFSDFFLN